MKLYELTKQPLTDFRAFVGGNDAPYNKDDIEAFFYRHGFTSMGSGSFATVMEHPKLRYVIKVFDYKDQGYPAFLKFIDNYPESKYLPKFIGKPMKVLDTVYAIRMEKLSKDIPKWFQDIFSTLRGVMLSPRHEQGILNAEHDHPPELVELVKALSLYGEQHRLADDLRWGNIMMRGDVPVITDPFVKI